MNIGRQLVRDAFIANHLDKVIDLILDKETIDGERHTSFAIQSLANELIGDWDIGLISRERILFASLLTKKQITFPVPEQLIIKLTHGTPTISPYYEIDYTLTKRAFLELENTYEYAVHLEVRENNYPQIKEYQAAIHPKGDPCPLEDLVMESRYVAELIELMKNPTQRTIGALTK